MNFAPNLTLPFEKIQPAGSSALSLKWSSGEFDLSRARFLALQATYHNFMFINRLVDKLTFNRKVLVPHPR